MATMAEEEEVRMEIEAVEAVYGDDCIILNTFPPHLHLLLKPRTADVHSKQFVEATMELRAGPQYPNDPPYIDIIGLKGLDENRRQHLINCLHDKARELESCLMIVSLCEEAMETLSSMNHPEGDCPLCLYPLLAEDDHKKSQPFMKLMSCFHCFHCECIVRWLKWFLTQDKASRKHSSAPSSPFDDELWQTSAKYTKKYHLIIENRSPDLRKMMGESAGNCPVCRKVFLAKDIEHVLDSVDSHGSDADVEEKKHAEELLECPLETSRRQKFEAILALQQEHGGLIEPPKDNILFSRLSLNDLVDEPEVGTTDEVSEQQQIDEVVREAAESTSSTNPTHQRSKRHQRGHAPTTESSGSSQSQTRPSASQNQRSGSRRPSRSHSKAPPQQWSRKE